MNEYQTHLYETNNPIIKYLNNVRIKNILKYLNINDNALEAGCGEGYLSSQIAKKVKTLVSLDINQDRISKARKINSSQKIEFLIRDITNTPLPQHGSIAV